jgi:hypothetical protein
LKSTKSCTTEPLFSFLFLHNSKLNILNFSDKFEL